jgi:hypothetical protein
MSIKNVLSFSRYTASTSSMVASTTMLATPSPNSGHWKQLLRSMLQPVGALLLLPKPRSKARVTIAIAPSGTIAP